MTIPYKPRNIGPPGAIFGSVALGIYKLPLAIYFLIWALPHQKIYDMRDLGYLTLVFITPGIFWGALLGYNAGLAWRAYNRCHFDRARELAIRFGAWGTCMNGVVFGMTLVPVIRYIDAFQYRWIAPMILFSASPCLQISLVLLLAGLRIPRRPEESVQVTQQYRL